MSSLITFALAVGSVGLWTLRVALTARGSRVVGSSVAATEAVVFVVAFSHVTGSLNAPLQVAIYGVGVGVGTFLGLTIDRVIKPHQTQREPTFWPEPGQSPEVIVMGDSPQDESTTVSLAPGSGSNSPAGVSSAHFTSAGEP